jgi:hypothetical protein
MDIVLMILTTIAVAIFLAYVALGPDEVVPTDLSSKITDQFVAAYLH